MGSLKAGLLQDLASLGKTQLGLFVFNVRNRQSSDSRGALIEDWTADVDNTTNQIAGLRLMSLPSNAGEMLLETFGNLFSGDVLPFGQRALKFIVSKVGQELHNQTQLP
jgi:hypothetical protein